MVILLLFPVSGLAIQEDEPLIPNLVAASMDVAIEQTTPLTPTPITIPITLVPTLTATVSATPTPEPPGTAKPDHPEREAALVTLEQIGAPTMTQSAGDIISSQTPAAPDHPTSTISTTLTVSPTPPLVSAGTEAVPALTPIVELTEVGISEDVFALRRPAADAGRDTIVLLIISGSTLLVLYLSMSRNLKSRDFSKYK